MIKKIIAGLCLLLSTVAFAQENNASPYSFYGVGDVKFKGTAENRSMGGIGVLPDSIHVNLQNPATYSSLKFTTFTVGATSGSTKFETETESNKAGRTTVDYLVVALPFNKFGVAFGLMPYTAVGYRIQNTTTPTAPGELAQQRQFDGSGGLNRVFGGMSYKITPNISLGADFQYYFGDIETTSIVNIPSAGLQYGTREKNASDYSGMGTNIGLMYQTRVSNKYDFYASATYSTEASLKSTSTRQIATIAQSTSGTQTVIDQIDLTISNKDYKLPSKFTVGSGFGKARKWFVGAEYANQGANELGGRFDGTTTNATFKNSSRYSVGGYYIPKFMSFTSYLSRVTYRAGLKYEDTGLVLSNEAIKDYSFSLGLSLPLSGNIGGSNLNIGAEFGKKGTKNAGLIQENYFNVFVGLSISDKWFVKRKYE
jgi:hypothetical protein